MANNENLIPIPGRLHSVATEGHVAGADEIYDDTQSKLQSAINADVAEDISDLQEIVGEGSVDTRIENAIKALDAEKSQTVGADGLALSITETDGKITSISGSIATDTYDSYGSASAAQEAAATDATTKVNTAKAELLGDAATDYNTLGKLEDAIQSEASTRETEIGTDSTAGSVKGRIKSLETLVGSTDVDSQIDAKINALDSTKSQTAGADGLALSIEEEDGKIKSISGSIAANTYDAYGAASTAKSDLLGDAASDYNTLGKLEDAIQAEATTRSGETEALDGRLDNIEDVIPSAASSSNQLADKSFVNSSISTATAEYQGSYNSVSDLSLSVSATHSQIATALGTEISGADNNDYCFVQIPTADATPTDIAKVDRYKYNGTAWSFEYELNNSGYTDAQWAAINSGITTNLVTAFGNKYDKPSTGIPSTDMSSDVQTSLGKADSAYQKPSGGIPDSDLTSAVQTSLGKADTAYQKPSRGIPSSDLADGVIPDISGKANKSEMSVVDGTGANADKTTITLKDGTSATVLKSHQDISGKQDVIDSTHKLAADLIDDTSSTNKFTNATEKQTWNAKQDALTFNTTPSADNKVATMADIEDATENCAYLEEDDSSAVIADFDPQADTVWKKAQVLSNAEKAQVKTNLGLPQEIYSKTEVNGLITTPNQQYVTVTTYASLPATGSANTIYRVSNYNGSTNQVDATMYSEYAWNGSDYTFLCVKSQIGEVFDITAYNSNTKYADLAAALGTNGANVPEGVRKGGMSVKYVSNSDNKYVQYRLMTDSFSTTVTDWQGVDDKAKIDSDNLIKSKGVSNALANQNFLPTTKITNTNTVSGYKLTANGTSLSDGNYELLKIELSGIELLKIKVQKDGDAVMQFQNNSSVPYETNPYIIGNTILKGVDGVVNVPEGATFLIISQLKRETPTYDINKVNITIDTIPSLDSDNLISSKGVAKYGVSLSDSRNITQTGVINPIFNRGLKAGEVFYMKVESETAAIQWQAYTKNPVWYAGSELTSALGVWQKCAFPINVNNFGINIQQLTTGGNVNIYVKIGELVYSEVFVQNIEQINNETDRIYKELAPMSKIVEITDSWVPTYPTINIKDVMFSTPILKDTKVVLRTTYPKSTSMNATLFKEDGTYEELENVYTNDEYIFIAPYKVVKMRFTIRKYSEGIIDNTSSANINIKIGLNTSLELAELGGQIDYPNLIPNAVSYKKAKQDIMDIWSELQFGMFIHWGVYSAWAGTYVGLLSDGTYTEGSHYREWLLYRAGGMSQDGITYIGADKASYKAKESDFTSVGWEPELICRLAKSVGMKYIILTIRHHEGFSLMPTDYAPWDISTSGADEDVVMQLKNACVKYGIKFCTYYSWAYNWTETGGYKQDGSFGNLTDPYTEAQHRAYIQEQLGYINEMIEKYNPYVMWFDGAIELPPDMYKEWDENIVKKCPYCIFTDRGAINEATHENRADYSLIEDAAPDNPNNGYGKFERCTTIQAGWGYSTEDEVESNYPSFESLLWDAVNTIGRGFNYALNVGPRGNGSFPDIVVSRFNKLSSWMRKYFYFNGATRIYNMAQPKWGRTIYIPDDKAVYLIVKPNNASIYFDGIDTTNIKGVTVFDIVNPTSQDNWSIISADRVAIRNIPTSNQDYYFSVVKVELYGDLFCGDYIITDGLISSMSLVRTLYAQWTYSNGYCSQTMFDGTYWMAKGANKVSCKIKWGGSTGNFKLSLNADFSGDTYCDFKIFDAKGEQIQYDNTISSSSKVSTKYTALTNGSIYTVEMYKSGNGTISINSIYLIE